MATPQPNRQQQLDGLITGIARDLMGVPLADAPDALNGTLQRLIDFFNVDQAFLRRNDHAAGTTILMAEWPERGLVPEQDPLYEVPFTADPIFAMCATLDRTFIAYPEDSPEYQTRIEEASGQQLSTMAAVPLLRADVTVGVLGLIRHDSERWPPEEVSTLGAIASLVAQMWGRHEAEAIIAHHAFHDELTDLPNRRFLTDRIAEIDGGTPASLLIIDIDNLKVINDGLNFEAGNQFLIQVAERLREAVRSDSVVARLAGDEFAVLLRGCEPANAETIANRLLERLGQACKVGGVAVVRSVSIGVAHSGALPGNDEVDLIKDADVALYEAKKNGKKRVVVYDTALQQRHNNSFELEIELRQALESDDELCLHYQPEVDLRTGEIVAVEALIRWHHPRLGLLNAGYFIAVAEESGLIVEIGDRVLRDAIAQLASWQDEHPDLVMRINVSPAQLMSRDLASQIRSLVGEFDVQSDRLCIEVTEHVMIADHKFTMEILNEIRAMGVQIALDDFGTGYSSMDQLKKLPIDALKIDRTFMIDLATSETDGAIVDATIRLAKALGLETVAEGIEEEAQITELLRRGCHRAQGFLLAKPDAPEEIGKLLPHPVSPGQLKLGSVIS